MTLQDPSCLEPFFTILIPSIILLTQMHDYITLRNCTAVRIALFHCLFTFYLGTYIFKMGEIFDHLLLKKKAFFLVSSINFFLDVLVYFDPWFRFFENYFLVNKSKLKIFPWLYKFQPLLWGDFLADGIRNFVFAFRF